MADAFEAADFETADEALHIGVWLDALPAADLDRASPHPMEALARLLPRLQPEAARILTDRRRGLLYRYLEYRPPMRGFGRYLSLYVEFVVAAAGALARVGDETAIPVLKQLASSTVDARIAAAGAAGLAALRARLDQAYLLRPAGYTDSSADTLLRPSSQED